ncbi:ABC transporter ATP-binding protein [Clostridiaceae bacterium M8S5]|nr:ABC transporter ATP-binding protein [Clostridiaceae bacterium M8S5]
MLKIENLCKKYDNFQLKNVSFEVPTGYIVGFIGKNGAGKSTTIKSMLNIVHPDSGSVTVFGKDYFKNELQLKQQIGLSMGGFDYYRSKKIKTLTEVYRRFFEEWDEEQYRKLMAYFKLNEDLKIKELSEGMRSKYATTLALSHNAKLLIFDEPTSGLDPIARNELLELFQSVIENGDKSILFSTQITSDLDRCADYIVFIRDGEIIANMTKDDLIDSHRVIGGSNSQLTDELRAKMIGVQKNAFGFNGMILTENIPSNINLKQSTPNIEDIILYYNLEDDHEKFDL